MASATQREGAQSVLPVGMDGGPTIEAGNRVVTGSLGALNDAVTINAQGAGSILVWLPTGLTGNVVCEGTIDGATWGGLNFQSATDVVSTTLVNPANVFTQVLQGGSFSQVRVRCSAYTSGSCLARLEASAAATIIRLPGSATFSAQIQGNAAHDAADSGNPVKIGGKANANESAAVAENDRVDAWFDLVRRLVVIDGHPSPEAPATANGSAAGLSVIATPGAAVRLYIKKVVITNRAAAGQIISLREGAAGTIRTTVFAPALGAAISLDYGSRGWQLPLDTALVADIAAASADVNVAEYYIAA